MGERVTSNTYWCRCLHVRHATLFLAIGYLLTHLLGMYLLIYLSVNLAEINNPPSQNQPIIRGLVAMRSVDVLPSTSTQEETEDDEEAKNATTSTTILRFTSIRWWINVFVINDPNGAKLSRYDLNMGMMFEAVNMLVSLMAIIGVLKRWPGCLVPFLLNQVFDIVFSVLIMCGVEVHGASPQPNLFTAGVLGSPIANAMSEKGSHISIVLGISKVLFKLCILQIVLMCIKHLREANNRIFRDERHEHWATRLLEGQLQVGSASPPPAYEDSELDLTAGQPNAFPTKKVTVI